MRRRIKTRHSRHPKKRTLFYKIKKMISALMAAAVLMAFILPLAYTEDRFVEGTKDVVKGVGSLPAEIAKESNNSNIINGVVVGSVKGAYCTTKNVITGVAKILTFPIKQK